MPSKEIILEVNAEKTEYVAVLHEQISGNITT
jgi:hypothetical protein